MTCLAKPYWQHMTKKVSLRGLDDLSNPKQSTTKTEFNNNFGAHVCIWVSITNIGD